MRANIFSAGGRVESYPVMLGMDTVAYDENIYDTIRKNIKKHRKDKKITAAELAELVDRSHDFIRQIESEKVGCNFSVETLYRISLALEVSLDALVEK